MVSLQASIKTLSETSARLLDRRELPAYSVPEASHYLNVPASTIRAWVAGTTTGKGRKKRPFKPVISPPLTEKLDLSFYNLAEIFVLRSLREFKIPLEHIREAITAVQEEFGWERPLIEEGFKTDGKKLFVERLGQHTEAVSKQRLLPGMDKHIQRVEWEHSLASRLYPFTRLDESRSRSRAVVIDYRRSFGRPIVDELGVATSIIYGRWRAGDSLSALTKDYRCRSRGIEEALCYESRKAKAA